MAIEFFTGFEGCVDITDLKAFFDSESGSNYGYFYYTATGGKDDSVGLHSDTQYGDSRSINKDVSAATTKTVGFHINNIRTANYNGETGAAFLGFSTDSYFFSIFNTSTGLKFYRGSTLLGTASRSLTNSWHHFEAKLFSSASAGTMQIKVDGELVLDLTGLDTGGDTITQIRFGTALSPDMYRDNFYIADDFQGEIYSYLLKPSSDESVQFTPLSGTDNFQMLQSDDGDTSYVESDTVGHKDLYGYEDLPVGLTPVATSIVTNARKEGTGFRSLQSISKQDAVEYEDSSVVTLPLTYPSGLTDSFIIAMKSLAPDGTAWTRDKINAMQWGFKVAG